MPLELYKRGTVYRFKGRIEELPGSEYYRKSTGKSSEAGARAVLREFQNRELGGHYSGDQRWFGSFEQFRAVL